MDTINGYLLDVQRMLVQLHREANERPAPFVDHAGVLRDSKTGRPINTHAAEVTEGEDAMGKFFYVLNPDGLPNMHLVLSSRIFLLRQRGG